MHTKIAFINDLSTWMYIFEKISFKRFENFLFQYLKAKNDFIDDNIIFLPNSKIKKLVKSGDQRLKKPKK